MQFLVETIERPRIASFKCHLLIVLNSLKQCLPLPSVFPDKLLLLLLLQFSLLLLAHFLDLLLLKRISYSLASRCKSRLHQRQLSLVLDLISTT